MAKISLFRIDFRLIHGQVITKWIKQTTANRIVVIDNALAKDAFMMDIYRMAAPPGIPVEVYDDDGAVAAWKENEMGEGDLLILVRDVSTAVYLKEHGFGVESIQVGGLGGSPGRVVVSPAVTLDQQDADGLRKLRELGCNVYVHVVPAEPKVELSKVLEKFEWLIVK